MCSACGDVREENAKSSASARRYDGDEDDYELDDEEDEEEL